MYKQKKSSILVAILIGLVLTVTPIFLLKRDIDTRNSMDSKAYSTRVTHREIRSRSNGETKITYTPTYYYIVNNKEYSCRTRSSSSFKSKDHKQIYYKANEPQNCYVEEGCSKYFCYALMFILGACCILLCKKNNIRHF